MLAERHVSTARRHGPSGGDARHHRDRAPRRRYVLSLRRLYDRIYTPRCSFKVQTRHDRVLLVLCKLPPQKHAAPLTWPRLNWAGSSDEAPPEPDHIGLGARSAAG